MRAVTRATSGSLLAGALVAATGLARADEEPPPATPDEPAAPVVEAPATVPPAPADQPAPPPPPEPPPALRYGGTLGIVSVPRLLSLEALVKYERWGFGASIEYLPPGVANFGDKTTLSSVSVEAQARYYVYKPIFVGVRAGYQYVRADSEKLGSETDHTESALAVGLRAGVLFQLKSGLLLGGDLGVTVPLTYSLTEPPAGSQPDSNARKVTRSFGEFPIPYVSLFRVGYFF